MEMNNVQGCFDQFSWESCRRADNTSQMNWTKENRRHSRKSDDWLNQGGCWAMANYLMSNCENTKLQLFNGWQITKTMSWSKRLELTKWTTFWLNAETYLKFKESPFIAFTFNKLANIQKESLNIPYFPFVRRTLNECKIQLVSTLPTIYSYIN